MFERVRVWLGGVVIEEMSARGRRNRAPAAGRVLRGDIIRGVVEV